MYSFNKYYHATRVRNYEAIPHIHDEGYFCKPLPTPPTADSQTHHWSVQLSPHDRLFYHQTLNRARKSAQYVENPNIPIDNLDFKLGTQYINNGMCTFPYKEDVVMQHETVGNPTFKVFRNTRDFVELTPSRVGHPRFGGIKDRMSINNVKLMISGHHNAISNPGYSEKHNGTNYMY